MYRSIFYSLGLLLILGISAALLSCSSSKEPTVTPALNDNYGNVVSYEGRERLGEFTLTLDLENESAEINPVNREGSRIVTGLVSISVEDVSWDPLYRIWDIDVRIDNPTYFAGFGPWIVFNKTGEQVIVNQDGFIPWINEPGNPPERVPLIAYAKENSKRIFYAKSSEYVNFQIHWPDNCDSFASLRFFIDVSFPLFRQHPIVENLEFIPADRPNRYSLVAYVKDWQQPPTGIGLDVWADLTPLDGSMYQLLYDDSNHGDGEANDDIWGCVFNAADPPEPVVVTVTARDWEEYQLENDVWFVVEGECVEQSLEYGFDDCGITYSCQGWEAGGCGLPNSDSTNWASFNWGCEADGINGCGMTPPYLTSGADGLSCYYLTDHYTQADLNVVSPEIILPESEYATLSFDHCNAFAGGAHLKVYFSAFGCDGPWIDLEEATSESGCQNTIIDISSYSSGQAMFRLRYYSQYSTYTGGSCGNAGVAIDNVEISGCFYGELSD